MTISLMLITPLFGALIVLLLPRGEAGARRTKIAGMFFSVATLIAALLLMAEFVVSEGGYQLVEKEQWIAQLGAWYAVGLNGIGMVLVLLTTVLVPIVLLAAWDDKIPEGRSLNAFLAWVLVLEALALGVFCALDALMFYMLFEATLIPLYFLIGGFGSTTGTGRAQRSYAAVKFLIYNLVGGLIMLAAIVALYAISAGQDGASYLLSDLQQLEFSDTTERLLFVGFFIAFAIKAPLWPLHTWLPDAAASATPGTSVLMVSIVDKIGTFGMIRWGLELFPGAADWASPVVIALALVSIIYGALLAIGQDDLRRFVAFTSVSHFGFIILGIFAFTSLSTAGSVLYMFNHGLSTAALFLITGMLIARRGSAKISDFGGIEKTAPILAGVLLVAGLSSLSLPGLAPFVSEFMVLAGTFTVNIPVAVIATLGIVLAAVYILVMYQRTMTGPPRKDRIADLSPVEIAAIAPAIVLIIGLGLYPKPMLELINPAVDAVTAVVEKVDPAPRVPAGPAADHADGEEH